MTSISLEEALRQLDLPSAGSPPGPVIHAKGGTLLAFAIPEADGKLTWTGAWIAPTAIRFIGPEPKEAFSSFAEAHLLSGESAQLFNRVVASSREFLRRIGELDEQLAEIQKKGSSVPLALVWPIKRAAALVRAQLDRALVAVAECTGPFANRFPGLQKAYPSLEGELSRLQQLIAGVQQSASDLILLRNAEESNRIAEAANELSRTSNRIAAYANISNIRMLGLTYLALVIALAGAVILFPNTGATILGMTSAAWVPGILVDGILVALAVIPLVWIFTRSWVKRLLTELGRYEERAGEGVGDLPEIPAGEAERAPREAAERRGTIGDGARSNGRG